MTQAPCALPTRTRPDQSVPSHPRRPGTHGSTVVVQYISIFGRLPPPKGSKGPRHQPLPQRSQR